MGLDVRARTIAVAFVPETGEVDDRSFGYDVAAVATWAAGLSQLALSVHEFASGFDLKRSLDSLDLPACVGAVGKMLKLSDDRVKADKRDATSSPACSLSAMSSSASARRRRRRRPATWRGRAPTHATTLWRPVTGSSRCCSGRAWSTR